MIKQQTAIKKLKFDDGFEPCPVAEGDELFPNGIFVFNITKMKEYILLNPDIFIPETIDVKGQYGNFLSINESHMPNVESSEPVILAEITPGRFNLIDGQHRMEKARRIGQNKIKAYKVNVEYHQRFLVTKKAYQAFVGYWNDKAKLFNNR
jgi:hypothetical protein